MIVNPTYLERHKDEGEDLRNFGVPLSHRFRSLKLWCVLRNYGLNGLQKYIRNHIEMAKYFKTLMESDPNFKIVNNVHLGLVCFKLFPPGKSPELLDYMNSQLLNNVNASGELHIIPTDYKGSRIIRYCVTMENATKPQIEAHWRVIQSHARAFVDSNFLVSSGVDKNFGLINEFSPRFSFTRTVSADVFSAQTQGTYLKDGAAAILVCENCTEQVPDGCAKHRVAIEKPERS